MTQLPTRRCAHRLLLALLCTSALALAGCAGADGEQTQRVVGAVDATEAAGTARVSMTTTVQGVDDPAYGDTEITGAGTIAAEGEVDFARQRGRMAVHLPGVQGVSANRMETVFLDGTAYSLLPLPEGVRWLRSDTAGALDHQSSQLGASSDPSAALLLLRGARSAELIGADSVRGRSTTHYRVTVDLQAVHDVARDELDRFAVSQLRAQLGTDLLLMEVWLDDRDRVVRHRYELDVAQHASGYAAPGPTSTVVEYHAFGVDVDIERPPDHAVVEIHELDPSLSDTVLRSPAADRPLSGQVIPDARAGEPIQPAPAQRVPDSYRGPDV